MGDITCSAVGVGVSCSYKMDGRGVTGLKFIDATATAKSKMATDPLCTAFTQKKAGISKKLNKIKLDPKSKNLPAALKNAALDWKTTNNAYLGVCMQGKK